MAAEQDSVETGWRRLIGFILLVMLLFALFSLVSYDWNDIGILKARDPQPYHNLIGPVGAWLAFSLFMAVGVGAYFVPGWMLCAGLTLMLSRRPRVWPRILWCTAFLIALVFLQEFRRDAWAERSAILNLGELTTGILGQWAMRGQLLRWFNALGAGLLLWTVLLGSAIMYVGPARIAAGIRHGIAAVRERIRNVSAAALDKRALIEREERRLEKERRKLERRLKRQAEKETAPEPAEQARATAAPASAAATRKTRRAPAPARVQTAEANGADPTAAESAMPESVAFRLPGTDLLNPPPANTTARGIEQDTEVTARILAATLAEFGIEAQVTHVEKGPVVTRYELLPAPGIRVEKISGLSNNLSLALKATSVRVQAPIPGKGVVGIEVPNATAAKVYLRDIVESEAWTAGQARLPLVLGKDVGGKDLVADLSTMPHLLIAGATGAGKTVCMNAILTGLFMAKTPDELRLMLVDPKIVEFSAFNHLPHLVVPVITNPKKVALGLRWAINEMEKRYKLFARAGVRNIEGFNHRVVARQEEMFGDSLPNEDRNEPPQRVPYIVIVIDELADLMLADQADIENHIARLAQLSRAVGIHMILSTQRPSVNVITGTIKANFPARIAFQVAQRVDSRTILDAVGAEKLLGQGDMLFLPPGTSKIVRAQGAYCADDEIRRVTDFIRTQAEPNYELEIKEKIESASSGGRADLDDGEDEDLLNQSIAVIRETRRASTSSLQRRLRIGYTRAARIMDILEERGIVGPPRGSDPREILIDLDGEIPDNSDVENADETDNEVRPDKQEPESGFETL